MKIVLRATVAAAMLVASSGGYAMAQDQPMDPGSVLLENDSDRDLTYSVRAPGGSWADQEIGGGDSVILSCGGCGAAHFNFMIESETKVMTYDLIVDRHYSIFWNNPITAWDVRLETE